jgi:regulator of nucleoside diphosphate kinase
MPDLIITEMDTWRLKSILGKKILNTEAEALENEIERASVVDFPEIPPNLITMNTRFRYLNTTDNKFGEMTLVYPHNANVDEGLISVMAPLGTAFLGLRENDEIDWTFPNGQKKTLRVLEILYQPEASGDLHL